MAQNRAFFQFILDQVLTYQETKSGRIISEAFQTLPSRDDFSDYYEVVDEPISLDEIQQKIDQGSYSDVSYLKDDFKMMADNAMQYNKKSSPVYKDAKLIMDIVDDAEDLFRLNQQLNQEARGILNTISDLQVPETGDRIASFFKQLPMASEKMYYQKITQPISLYDVEKKVDGSKYSSLGEFRSDLQLLIDNAVLYYGAESIQAKAAVLIKDAIKDLPEDQEGLSAASIDPSSLPGPEVPEMVWNNGQDTLRVGDFVYLVNEADTAKPLIGHIFNVYKNREDNQYGIRVCWFFRPEQTIHKANTKFMPNEVLKCSQFENYGAHEIIGRCQVLFVKDYVRGKPKNIPFEHVYVCESRYNMHAKTQTKIKMWHTCLPEPVRHMEPDLDIYQVPLTIPRTPLDRSLVSSPPNQRKRRKESQTADEEFAGADEGIPTSISGNKKRSTLSVEKAAAQFNFAGMPKQTKDLITRLHSQRPLYVVPAPTGAKNLLPAALVSAFDTRGDGKVRWFPAPPVQVVGTGLGHSPAYISWKKKQEKGMKENEKVGICVDAQREVVDVEMAGDDEDEQVVDVDYKAVEVTLLEYAKFLSKDLPFA